MDNGEFVAAYTAHKYYGPQNSQNPEDFYSNPDLERTLVDVRGWGRHFSTLMRHRLHNRLIPAQTHLKQLSEYQSWNDEMLYNVVDEVNDAVAAEPRAIRYASELTFHLINGAMADQWKEIIYQKPNRLYESSQYRSQTVLAATAMKLMRAQDVIRQDEFADKTQRLSFVGSQITELDAGIALLELVKYRKETLIVVPAPPDFESTYRERNADYMILDRVNNQTHGIQVKNSLAGPVAQEIMQQYDPDFITLIDGEINLGNQLSKGEEISSVSTLRFQTGLLSIDQLQRVSMSSLLHEKLEHRRWEVIQAWNDADTRSNGRDNFIYTAMKNIEPSIIDGLYKEPARTFVKPERLEA